jgi:peptidoglycan/LPS O-acetylase OafA/YrhL
LRLDSKAASRNLDLLRAVAVSFVLAFHLLRAFEIRIALLGNMGAWGVLMFFVHTSLVLMFSLERLSGEDPPSRVTSNLFARFMVRRTFRIFPLSVLAVLTVWLLDIPAWDSRGGHFIGLHLGPGAVISNLLLIQNLTHSESILATLWSLPYEFQMYLTLPFFFGLARRMTTSKLVATYVAISLAIWLLPPWVSRAWDMPSYVPCFLAGVLVYRVGRTSRFKLPGLLWPVVVVAITVLYFRVRLHHASPRIDWLACLALGLLIPFVREIPAALHPPCRVIAQYSYGIYLTHFVTIWLAFSRLAFLPRSVQWIVFGLVTAGSSVLLFHFVEEPMMRVGARLANRLRKAPDREPVLQT